MVGTCKLATRINQYRLHKYLTRIFFPNETIPQWHTLLCLDPKNIQLKLVENLNKKKNTIEFVVIWFLFPTICSM
jgi:hypothetical protein